MHTVHIAHDIHAYVHDIAYVHKYYCNVQVQCTCTCNVHVHVHVWSVSLLTSLPFPMVSYRLERERIRTWAAKELQEPSSGSAVKLEKSQSGYKVTLPSPLPPTGRSRSKSPQRSLGLLGRGHKKQSSGPEQQLVDVQSLVDVSMTTSPHPPPPQQTLQPQVQAQNGQFVWGLPTCCPPCMDIH